MKEFLAMFKRAFLSLFVVAGLSAGIVSAPAEASTYTCAGQLNWAPSMLWNANYQIHIRPSFDGNALGQVRVTRTYIGANPRVEMIQMRCVPGSNGAEFDCIENSNYNNRGELLAAQFFVNNWTVLYATPFEEWAPYALGNFGCSRF
ncbi:MAG: hypothetical protein EBR52_09555 [Microbacteriaceae bacterium]|nr:hypothetical protein [Microbacteriaceae bacterium]